MFILQSLDKAENGKFKVYLRSRHVIPVLELCKVWSSLWLIDLSPLVSTINSYIYMCVCVFLLCAESCEKNWENLDDGQVT